MKLAPIHAPSNSDFKNGFISRRSSVQALDTEQFFASSSVEPGAERAGEVWRVGSVPCMLCAESIESREALQRHLVQVRD